MRVVERLGEIARREPAVLTIGFFDGVHRGHQQLVRRTVELAAQMRARAVAITCWPHPLAVLRPEAAPQLLTTAQERLARLQALGGLDVIAVTPFTSAVARHSREDELAALRDHFDIRAIVEGPDFALGHDGQGTLAWLREAGFAAGFAVEELEVRAGGERISSARIRALLATGAVDAAADLLGAPYSVVGTVVRGDQRGRLLGFPTANLRPDPVKLIPGNGVYAVRAALVGEDAHTRPAVANVGIRPTFGEGKTPLIEVHLLDSSVDLYDQPLRAAFIARLREERRFPGIEALTAQIASDATRARALLAESVDGSAAGPPATPDGTR